MRVEAVHARIPSSVRSVAHGSVQESPCRAKDPRRRSQWRLSEGEVCILSVFGPGGKADCCSCRDGEEDSCGLVFEEEGREGEGGYVSRHAGRAVRCYCRLFQRSFAVFLTFTPISIRCSCLKRSTWWSRCLHYAESRKTTMPFARPRSELDDAAAPPIADGCLSELEKRAAKSRLARMGAEHADDLQPRRRPLSSALSPSSFPPTSPPARFIAVLAAAHQLFILITLFVHPLFILIAGACAAPLPISFASLPPSAARRVVAPTAAEQCSAAAPLSHPLPLVPLSFTQPSRQPPSYTSLVAPPSIACSHLTAAMANSQLPRAQSAPASTSSHSQSAVCWISWPCSTPSTISEDGG